MQTKAAAPPADAPAICPALEAEGAIIFEGAREQVPISGVASEVSPTEKAEVFDFVSVLSVDVARLRTLIGPISQD